MTTTITAAPVITTVSTDSTPIVVNISELAVSSVSVVGSNITVSAITQSTSVEAVVQKVSVNIAEGVTSVIEATGLAISNSGAGAYQYAVINGFVGTEVDWLESLNGTDGEDGEDGTNGTNGADGADAVIGYSAVIREVFEAALMIKNQRILVDHYVRFGL